MPFTPPSWVPKLPFDPPDSISVGDFLLEERYGRHPLGYSFAPFTCGISGKEYSALEVKERVDFLARGLAKELGWKPNEGTEWDKVIGVFSVNTVSDTLGATTSIILTAHRLTPSHWHGQLTDWAASQHPRTPPTMPPNSDTSSRTLAQSASSLAFPCWKLQKQPPRHAEFQRTAFTSWRYLRS